MGGRHGGDQFQRRQPPPGRPWPGVVLRSATPEQVRRAARLGKPWAAMADGEGG